jgi:hypothetical protein
MDKEAVHSRDTHADGRLNLVTFAIVRYAALSWTEVSRETKAFRHFLMFVRVAEISPQVMCGG